MIEINLLPGARKQKRSKSSNVDFGALFGNMSARFRDPYLIGAVASTVVAILIVGGMFWWQDRSVKQLTAREQVAVQDSTRYSAVIAQRRSAEAQRDSVVRQINIIKAIDGTRYIWPHILDEVSRALPPYTWLKTLQQTSAVSNLSPEVEAGVGEGNAKGKPKMVAEADSAANAAGTLTFRIVGQTVDIQALTRFMKQLEASPWIEGVQLVRTDMILVQPANKEATEFTLDMKLQKPDAALIRRIPLSIAVR
jgi:Tfp pilus assembly protein PilN